MPQMAPMNWLMLYMFFSMMFIAFNFMNYYMFLICKKTEKTNKIFNKFLNWKW
uniref:ATP synthase complex subunit 8 n=1 Tax=Scarodytes savinensis TaxID=483878 RepID=A0A894JTR9_9DYTI|nr:ATP synthase F0 subunit 8 [Scarodytes savinensis]QRV62884.1 ATP synthase F0 subunit 8 [Scarodytes savinensis]